MRSIQGIGTSGLEAATRRLEVSADNVANALTPDHRPARVEAAAGGGVATRVAAPLGDPGRDSSADPAGDPGGAVRADRALLAASGIDLAAEVVAQAQATALFRANLATLETGDRLDQALLGLVR